MAKHHYLLNPSATEQQLRDLAERFYDQTFDRYPVEGSVAGKHEYDGDMGHSRPIDFTAQARLVEKTLAAVEDLPVQDFSPGGMLDRRAFLANLRLEWMQLVDLERWRNDPQMHINTVATAIHHLLARHAQDLAPVAEALLSRLKKIPRYLDEAVECVRRPIRSGSNWPQRTRRRSAPCSATSRRNWAASCPSPSGRACTAPSRKRPRPAGTMAGASAGSGRRRRGASRSAASAWRGSCATGWGWTGRRAKPPRSRAATPKNSPRP